MSSKKTVPHQMSGPEFVRVVSAEIEARNKGIGRVTLASVSRAAGLSGAYLRCVMKADRPNPTSLAMRSILYVLGYNILSPEADVIPHLKARGVYDPEANLDRAS